MRAYEYLAEILPVGHLFIPEHLIGKLIGESKVRVMLLLEDEDAQWNNFALPQFIKGYPENDAIYDSL